MKKLLLGLAAVCLLVSAPSFAAVKEDIKKEEAKAATNFSVKVNSGTNALAGATVKLFQGGSEIGSAVTNSRGIAALSVPNQEPVSIKITAKGHNPAAKDNFVPNEGEIVPVSLNKLTLKPGVGRTKK